MCKFQTWVKVLSTTFVTTFIENAAFITSCFLFVYKYKHIFSFSIMRKAHEKQSAFLRKTLIKKFTLFLNLNDSIFVTFLCYFGMFVKHLCYVFPKNWFQTFFFVSSTKFLTPIYVSSYMYNCFFPLLFHCGFHIYSFTIEPRAIHHP